MEKMTSDRQREANRRNALLSTGPRSDEGKQRVRRNALKHGLAARRPPGHSREGLAGNSTDAGALGLPILPVDEAAEARRDLELVARYRAELMENATRLVHEVDDLEEIVSGLKWFLDELDRLNRYEAKAHATLKKIQAENADRIAGRRQETDRK
jgi:hypothetical protein